MNGMKVNNCLPLLKVGSGALLFGPQLINTSNFWQPAGLFSQTNMWCTEEQFNYDMAKVRLKHIHPKWVALKTKRLSGRCPLSNTYNVLKRFSWGLPLVEKITSETTFDYWKVVFSPSHEIFLKIIIIGQVSAFLAPLVPCPKKTKQWKQGA